MHSQFSTTRFFSTTWNQLQSYSKTGIPYFIGLFLFCIVIAGCHLKSPAARLMPDPATFDWQGHRGARGLMPENTVPAFLKALEYPQIRTLELDLAISKDSQVVVSHDPWLSAEICSMPNGAPIAAEMEEKLLLYHMPYSEIKTYDCGKRGNKRFPEQQAMEAHIPLLSEVIQTVQAYCQEKNRDFPFYNIEIKSQPDWDGSKHPPVAQFAELVLAVVQKMGIQERVCIQSFDPRALREVKKRAPEMTVALLVENTRGMDANVKELGFIPDIYSPYYKMVTVNVVQKAHELHMRIIPWTVNDRDTMVFLKGIGVDGIITDYPNRALANLSTEE